MLWVWKQCEGGKLCSFYLWILYLHHLFGYCFFVDNFLKYRWSLFIRGDWVLEPPSHSHWKPWILKYPHERPNTTNIWSLSGDFSQKPEVNKKRLWTAWCMAILKFRVPPRSNQNEVPVASGRSSVELSKGRDSASSVRKITVDAENNYGWKRMLYAWIKRPHMYFII